MSNEIMEIETAPLTAVQLRSQVNLIQEVMREVMHGPTRENPAGTHYGVIPGCGKPSLYKAGAEKLSMTFRLRPIIDNDRDISIERMENGHREIRIYCHVMNMAGVELATGVGSCSTMESKFRYRGGEKIFTGRPVPTEYWNLKKEEKIEEAKKTIGSRGFGVAKNPDTGQWEICEFGEKMENPDIADTYNTVLKMAKKRAYVDGILSATAASDIFTQDVEDFSGNVEAPVINSEKKTNGKPEVQMPKAKEEKPTNAPVKEEEYIPWEEEENEEQESKKSKNSISDPQGKRLYAIAMGSGRTKESFNEELKTKFNYASSRDIDRGDYERICTHFSAK